MSSAEIQCSCVVNEWVPIEGFVGPPCRCWRPATQEDGLCDECRASERCRRAISAQ